MLFRRCEHDEDFAKVSIFLLDHKREMHPSFSTMDMVTQIYSYVTQGHMLQAVNTGNEIIGASAYFLGTPEQEFQDGHVAFVDMVIVDPAYQGTPVFISGLVYMIKHIMKEHPKVEEVRFVALAENKYVCKMYSKFMKKIDTREGVAGKEIVFGEKIKKISTFLGRFSRV